MAKKYNEIEAKDNMVVNNDKEETAEVKKDKELTQVVTVVPKKHKQGLFGRLIAGVVGPEGAPSIGSYVNEEIIKPAIKNIVVDAVTSGINMIMYGEKAPNRGNRYGGGYQSNNRTTYRPNTNYSSNYTPRYSEPERKVAKTKNYGVEEYVIEDRFDAAHVISTLTENADMYDSVSVADYYDLIGVASVYTDNTYGWTIDSITSATIVPVRGGYVIKFPQVEVI